MKVFLSFGDATAELKVDGPYSPDILSDVCHRAAELIIQQRAATVALEVEDAEPPS